MDSVCIVDHSLVTSEILGTSDVQIGSSRSILQDHNVLCRVRLGDKILGFTTLVVLSDYPTGQKYIELGLSFLFSSSPA